MKYLVRKQVIYEYLKEVEADLPHDAINKANQAFASDIIDHFNNQYVPWSEAGKSIQITAEKADKCEKKKYINAGEIQ